VSLLFILTSCKDNKDNITTSSEEVSSETKEHKTDNIQVISESDSEVLDYIYDKLSSMGIKDIRELPKDYNSEAALANGDYVGTYDRNYNEGLYGDFVEDYQGGNNAFIRTVNYTFEGDAVIDDYYYDCEEKILYVIYDSSRDRFGGRTVHVIKYNKTAIEKTKKGNFFIAYNDQYSIEDDGKISGKGLIMFKYPVPYEEWLIKKLGIKYSTSDITMYLYLETEDEDGKNYSKRLLKGYKNEILDMLEHLEEEKSKDIALTNYTRSMNKAHIEINNFDEVYDIEWRFPTNMLIYDGKEYYINSGVDLNRLYELFEDYINNSVLSK